MGLTGSRATRVRHKRSAARAYGNASGEAEPALLHGDKAALADHDVVEHLDLQQVAGTNQVGGDGDIVAAGRGIAGGVIVNGDELRGVVADGVAEDLGG